MGRRLALGFWLLFALASAAISLTHPEWLEPETLKGFFLKARAWTIPVFFLACILRILLFIPAMAIVLAGLLLIEPTPLLLLATVGFLASSSLLYFGAQWLGLDQIFEAHYPKQLESLRQGLERHGNWVVFLWAFLPVVPTDLISYVAGTARMPFARFLIAVTAGQSILLIVVAYGGHQLLQGFF